MSPFQIILLAVFGGLIASTLYLGSRRRITLRTTTFFTLVWLVAGMASISPDMTSRVARWVGIGRGTDLLMYCSIVVMLIGFFLVYIRLIRLRRSLTMLVRHLALVQAQDRQVISPAAPHQDAQ